MCYTEKLYLKSISISRIKSSYNNGVNTNKHLKHFFKESANVIRKSYIIKTEKTSLTLYTYENKKNIFSARSILFYIHGGGWKSPNWDFYNKYLSHLCATLDTVIATVDFRCAPLFKYDDIIQDCYDALLWIDKAKEFWQIDKDRFYVMGEGTGGNIASSLMYTIRDEKKLKIKGQILISPLLDARLRTQSFEEFENTPTLTREEVRKNIKDYTYSQKDILSPLVSPLLNINHFLIPKTFLISSEFDPQKDDSIIYSKKLIAHNIPVIYYECEGKYHNFIFSKYVKEVQNIEKMIKMFINENPLEFILKSGY